LKTDTDQKFIPGKTRIKYGGAVFGKEERAAIEKVLDRNWWTIAEECFQFEKELAKKTQTDFAVFVNSGSSALFLIFAFISKQMPPAKNQVIVPAVNFPTLVSSILYAGLKPVFVDVDLQTFCIDPKKIKAAITPATCAVAAVNIAGNMADVDALLDIRNEYGLPIILDNCDGFGSRYKGKRVESYFDLSATSFHAAHIITTGEGGAVFVRGKYPYSEIVSLREWGRSADSDDPKQFDNIPDDYPQRYIFVNRGFNFKPLELQAAMGREQLKKLDIIRRLRAKNFNRLDVTIRKYPDFFQPVKPYLNAEISWFCYPFLVKTSRKKFVDFLESRNIETRTIFAGNIVCQPAYVNIGRIAGSLENSDCIFNHGLFLSVHPFLTSEMLDYVSDSIKEFCCG